MDGFAVYQDLSYSIGTGGFSFPNGENNIETVVSTSTGRPFINVGSYRHCSTASTADCMRFSGPETYRALFTAPLLPMIT